MVNFRTDRGINVNTIGSYDPKGRPFIFLEFKTPDGSVWKKFPVFLSTADSFSIFGTNFAYNLNIKDEDAVANGSIENDKYFIHCLLCKLPDERQIVLEAWFPMQSNANQVNKIRASELTKHIGFVLDSECVYIFS